MNKVWDNKKKKRRFSVLLSPSEILIELFQKRRSALSYQFKRFQIWSHWRTIVGETISEYSDPVGYSHGKLYVAVSNSVRLQEMSFLEPFLREKINQFIGYNWVKSVRLTLDRRDVPPSKGFNPHYEKWKNYFQTKDLS